MPPAVVVAAGRRDAVRVEDTLTGLSAQTLPVRLVLVTARSAGRLVGAFQDPKWTAGRRVADWLGQPAMPPWVAVLQAGDIPFGHWAERLADLTRPGEPTAVFGRMAHQPARRAGRRGAASLVTATGPVTVEPQAFTAALPSRAAAVTPPGWWPAAAPDRLPPGLPVHTTDEVLALRFVLR